jgi:hypothetical protein
MKIINGGLYSVCSDDVDSNGIFIVPNGIEYIAKYACMHCPKLKKLMIPSSVKEIERYAFYQCDDLEDVIMEDGGVTSIECCAFCQCSKLKNIKLSSNIKYIQDFAFAMCNSLESIKLPVKLISIGDCAFHSCKNLKVIIYKNTELSIKMQDDECLVEVSLGDVGYFKKYMCYFGDYVRGKATPIYRSNYKLIES